MTDKVQKIRAEIERLKDVDITEFPNTNWVKGRNFALVSLEVFIDSMQEEPTIPDIVDEHWWEMLGEEPISQDMWEASKQYALRQVFASTDAEMTEQAYLSLKLFSGFEIAVAHKDGAEWQKEQFIKRLCNHANIDKMVEKFEDKYKPEKVLDTEYYKRGIFDTIKTIKEG